jgi:hypothetical protein
VQLELSNQIVAYESADHEHIAVREVNELDDAVDHRIAQGDHCVYKSQLQAAEHDLQKK